MNSNERQDARTPGKKESFPLRFLASRRLGVHFLLYSAGLLVIAGCGTRAGQLFPPLSPPLVWPSGNEPPRIRYVGQLATSDDLKPAKSGFDNLGEALFGKHEALAMLSPIAVCTDNRDRLFVADSNAQLVHVFNLNTRKYEQWRPTSPQNRFDQPVGVAFDPLANHLYVADSVAGAVFVFDNTGKLISTISGAFKRPAGLCFDAKRSRLLVVDPGEHQLLALTPEGQLITRIGTRGSAKGQFNFPTFVTVDSQGVVYVADSLNFRVQQFTPDLKPLLSIGKKGDRPGYMSTPKGVATDSDDHLYVVDANFEAVQIFSKEGNLLLAFGSEGHSPGEFWLPAGIFIDSHNRIYVADSYNRRVQVFDYIPEGSK